MLPNPNGDGARALMELGKVPVRRPPSSRNRCSRVNAVPRLAALGLLSPRVRPTCRCARPASESAWSNAAAGADGERGMPERGVLCAHHGRADPWPSSPDALTMARPRQIAASALLP